MTTASASLTRRPTKYAERQSRQSLGGDVLRPGRRRPVCLRRRRARCTVPDRARPKRARRRRMPESFSHPILHLKFEDGTLTPAASLTFPACAMASRSSGSDQRTQSVHGGAGLGHGRSAVRGQYPDTTRSTSWRASRAPSRRRPKSATGPMPSRCRRTARRWPSPTGATSRSACWTRRL